MFRSLCLLYPKDRLRVNKTPCATRHPSEPRTRVAEATAGLEWRFPAWETAHGSRPDRGTISTRMAKLQVAVKIPRASLIIACREPPGKSQVCATFRPSQSPRAGRESSELPRAKKAHLRVGTGDVLRHVIWPLAMQAEPAFLRATRPRNASAPTVRQQKVYGTNSCQAKGHEKRLVQLPTSNLFARPPELGGRARAEMIGRS